jgi:alpha-tubulin suppressor-like RCC1 family protein
MALNFPDSPSTNEYFTDNTSGFSYQWNGVVWISVASTQTTSLKEFDDISGSFNGSTTTFSLTFANGSTKVYPLGVNQITIVIGGILQNAGDDFTISGDQITFTTAPDAGLTFQGMFYGSSVSMNSAAAGSITTSSLSTGSPIWNVGGDVTVAGIVTVGSSSVVIDGPSNEIRVGTGATVNASGIVIGGAGIVTASYFYGDGSGLGGIVSGIGTTGSINTSGIITASSFSGSGSGLSNIGGQLSAITYSPGIGATEVAAASNIVITFNKPVKANTGTITLKEGAADGTTVESFNVETSDKITISGGQITIDPTSNFGVSTSFYVAVPAGAYKDILNTSSSPGISTYSFETAGVGYTSILLYRSGFNNTGQLGLNDVISRSSPTQLPGTQWSLDAYTAFGQGKGFSGGNTNSGIKNDGTAWIWGRNNYGQLAQNDQILRSSPIQLPGTQWRNIFTSQNSGFATKTDGTAWVWGEFTTGVLGLNDAIYRSSPTQLPGTQWTRVKGSSARNGAYGFKTDGSLWVWGYGQFGEHGQNNRINYSSPIQIPGPWSFFNNTNYVSGGIKTDGTLWMWGYNFGGSHAQNGPSISRSSPALVPGTEWESMSASYHSGAIKTDGSLWLWGQNNNGQLGQNSVVNYSSPIQMPGTWSYIDTVTYTTLAIKTDDTVWVWGLNSNGSLGQNDPTVANYSSPVQLPGTQWIHGNLSNDGLTLVKEVS